MKRIFALVVQLLILCPPVPAGEIFGTIKEGTKALPKGTKVEIISPHKTYSGQTDNYGSYRLYVREKGKCSLKVHVDKLTPSIDIFSYEKSTRYDLVLERTDSTVALKRK